MYVYIYTCVILLLQTACHAMHFLLWRYAYWVVDYIYTYMYIYMYVSIYVYLRMCVVYIHTYVSSYLSHNDLTVIPPLLFHNLTSLSTL